MFLRFALFIGVILLVLGGLHYYLWIRLVRDPAWPPSVRLTGTVLFLLLWLSTPLGLFLRRSRQAIATWISAGLLTWLGVVFVLSTVVALLDLGRLAVRGTLALIAWWHHEAAPENPARRQLFSRALAELALPAAGTLVALGVRQARGEVGVRELPVRLERLPRALDGLTIVQLTDLHVSWTLGRDFVTGVVETVNRLRPDVVAITGDLVDGSVEALAESVAPLGGLQSRYGTLFCPGNHEYYSGIAPWLTHLRGLGMRLLLNERIAIGDAAAGGAQIDIAGIEDFTGHPDLDRALAGRDPARELVLLAHQPRAIGKAAAADVGLQLSGHTHGGQIWPFGWAVYLQQPYIAGLHRHGPRTQIYVSRGTGYWGPPLRIGAPAEITRVVLTRG